MKPTPKISLRSRTLVFAALSYFLAVSLPATAVGPLPVIDAASLRHTTVTAIENVAQTAKQIEQYRTQLQQYQNMLQNTTAAKDQIWDAASRTMDDLRGAIDTLDYYKRTLGGVDAYLQKFQGTEGFRNSPCYSVAGCTPQEWAVMKHAETYTSTSQKMATDGLFRGLDLQHKNLQNDAARLQRLQASAQSADGQMQALGYANQLASHQSNQLLQIRALLIAQQNVIATRNQALIEVEAKQKVASDVHYAVPATSNRELNKGY